MALCLVIGGKVKTTGCISYPIIYIWYLEMAMIANIINSIIWHVTIIVGWRHAGVGNVFES